MKSSTPKPRGLSPAARAWKRRLAKEYGLDGDAAAELLLDAAMRAFDRAQEAQAIVDAQGVSFIDRFGQQRLSPAVLVERDSRSLMARMLAALRLDVEPLQPIGRPPGPSRGER